MIYDVNNNNLKGNNLILDKKKQTKKHLPTSFVTQKTKKEKQLLALALFCELQMK